MEQMLSCLTAHRESPRAVRPRLQPALHRLADIQIFLLNAITYRNTLLVVLAMCVADVSKIEIKNHMAMVDVDWEYQDRVHVAFVAIDHQIWILPEVPGSIALAGRAGRGISIGRNHGTCLQAIPILVLNGVFLVIENRIQSLMQMRNVVAAIEIVIDKDFPIAMNVVHA